jgi:ribosomal protein S18 acetylase RimI-like enzyme
MEYIIRPCKEDDLAQLVMLCQKHAEYERAEFNADEKEALLEEALFAEDAKLFCFVVEINQQVAGYFSYTFDFSTWDAKRFLYLDCLYLDDHCRGHGIGEEVIRKLKEIALQENCVNIQWQTPTFNERAIKFYNRIGGIGKEKMRFTIRV